MRDCLLCLLTLLSSFYNLHSQPTGFSHLSPQESLSPFSNTSGPPVQWKVTPEEIFVEAGKPGSVKVQAFIKKGWHLYANPKGPGPGLPLVISLINSGLEDVLEVQYPKGHHFEIPDLNNWVYAYEKEVSIPLTLNIPKGFKEGLHTFEIQVKGLVCQQSCIPVHQKISFKVHIKEPLLVLEKNEGGKPSEAVDFKKQESFMSHFLLYAALGVLAGLILNVMPCVLPVLSLKLYSLVHGQGGEKPWTIGLSYGAGVMSVFMILASLATFLGMMWGEQFQSLLFITLMFSMTLVFALSLFDVFTLPVPSFLGGGKGGHGLLQSFSQGVLATLLATPCGAPFLGGILGWTLQQSPFIIFTIYAFIGLGMAFPFILILIFPKLLKFLPKPGPWMVRFRQVSGVLILGTAFYLLSLAPSSQHISLGCFGLVVILCSWAIGRWVKADRKIYSKILSWGVSLALLLGAYHFILKKEKPQHQEVGIELHGWELYKESLFADGLRGPMVIDFTANWCPNCKINEALVLHREDVMQKLRDKNIRLVVVDLSFSNPSGKKLLEKLGGRTIPFLAYFPDKSSDSKTLEGLFSKASFMDFIEKK